MISNTPQSSSSIFIEFQALSLHNPSPSPIKTKASFSSSDSNVSIPPTHLLQPLQRTTQRSGNRAWPANHQNRNRYKYQSNMTCTQLNFINDLRIILRSLFLWLMLWRGSLSSHLCLRGSFENTSRRNQRFPRKLLKKACLLCEKFASFNHLSPLHSRHGHVSMTERWLGRMHGHDKARQASWG